MAFSQFTKDAQDPQQRRRRTHKKSRRGCSGCKQRRIKCDEEKPCCRRCRGFGLECTYDGKVAELTFAGEGCFRLDDVVQSASRKASEHTQRTAHLSMSTSLEAYRPTSLPLSAPRTLDQATAVVGHLNGLPSPPTSDGEETGPVRTSSIAELEVLARFNERTVLSVGTRQAAKIYQREVFELACTVSRHCPPTLRDSSN